MANEELEALKQEAKELGIEFSANIGAVKLQEKIDAYYESQNTSSKELKEAIAEVEATEKSKEKVVASNVSGKTNMAALARQLYEEARKTRVITIIDNDQRVNNQTTTCKVNWSNQYHDMGTMTFPLNTPIEIPQGFINVLEEVMIPMHTRDPKTQLAVTVMRPRYTINYEDK